MSRRENWPTSELVDKLEKDEMGDPVGAGPPRGVEPLDLTAIVPELEDPVEFLVRHWWTTFDPAFVTAALRGLRSAGRAIAAGSIAGPIAPGSVVAKALGLLAANIGRLRLDAKTIATVNVIAGRGAAWRIRVEEI